MMQMNKEPIPEVDMWQVAKNAEVQRRAILGFAPRIGLVIVDYDDLDRIDSIYLQCQKLRDYYRDPHNKLHKPTGFQPHRRKCGIKVDQSVQHLTQPIRWVEERRPVVYPFPRDTSMNLGSPIVPMISGRYSKSSSVSYVR
ncbi:uncharacterized protein LOC108100973 [Drosophila ficusphila]|uniref:uncharacterized protein LOC108100973 n=1 Tax=Drosophila ficusphila TaxID=30025 RepID=UPI0007E6F388|nr:uncharacterized protein LOC108100973 [Drosophila ficusphila]